MVSSDGSAVRGASIDIEASCVGAVFFALFWRGFRFTTARRVRVPLSALPFEEPVSGETLTLSWLIFFFFGTDFIVDGFISFIVHRVVGKCFLDLL